MMISRKIKVSNSKNFIGQMRETYENTFDYIYASRLFLLYLPIMILAELLNQTRLFP